MGRCSDAECLGQTPSACALACANADRGMADDLRRWRMTTGNDHLPTTRKFTYNLLLHMQQKDVCAILCNGRGYMHLNLAGRTEAESQRAIQPPSNRTCT